ncbi:MAG: hypothetical protein ACREOR_07750, partial [Candidatus Binatia bacterium]
ALKIAGTEAATDEKKQQRNEFQHKSDAQNNRPTGCAQGKFASCEDESIVGTESHSPADS